MRKGFQPRTNICRAKDREFIGGKTDILNRWHEYFKKLLNLQGSGFNACLYEENDV